MNLIWNSSEIVLSLLVAASCGYLLVRKNILHEGAIKDLSKIVVYLILPCLLFSKIITAISLESLRDLWIFPITAVILVVLGLVLGSLTGLLCRQKELSRVLAGAMAFSNSGYLPLGILAALAFQGSTVFGNTDIVAEGTAYISLYLILYSPMMWGIGFFLIAGGNSKDFKVKNLFPPPVMAALGALVLGIIPFTKNIFVGQEAPLNLILQASSLLGQATVPLALIILGGNLALNKPSNKVKRTTIATFLIMKFGLMPCISILIMMFFKRLGYIDTPMMAFIIILEGCMPPGMNLAVMCQVKGNNKESVTTLLFWSYMFVIPALAFWLYIVLRICQN